jgi:ATP-dependent Lon protease
VAETEFLNESSETAGRPASATAPLPPDALIIIPVRGTVMFPGHVLPITVGRPRSVTAAQQAVREQRQVGILMQRNADTPEPAPIDMHRIGTIASVVRYITAPDGTHHLVAQGDQRFEVREFLNGWPFMVARVAPISEPEVKTPEIEARFLHLKNQAIEAVQLLPQAPPELLAAVQNVSAPGALADLTASYMDIAPEHKQEILETIDIGARMEKVSRLLAQRIEILRLSQEIGRQTKAALDERQREVLLREQMAAIQRQLGEGGRNGRARQGHHQCENAERGRGPRAQGIAPAAAHAGSGRRICHGADLYRLAGRTAVVAARGDADRHQGSAAHSQ